MAVLAPKTNFDSVYVDVARLVNEKNPFMLCIQESKLSVVDDLVIKALWGDGPNYSYQPSVGASGGLVSVWDSSCVNVWSSMNYGHVLVIKGTVIRSAEDFVIMNVYAPCDSMAKKDLWDNLTSIIANCNDSCLCVCGDFNSVRNVEEKKGRGSVFRQVDADLFNNFTDDKLTD